MRVADVEAGALVEHGVVDGRTGTEAPVVDVATEDAGRDAAAPLGLRRGDAHHTEVWSDRAPRPLGRTARGRPDRAPRSRPAGRTAPTRRSRSRTSAGRCEVNPPIGGRVDEFVDRDPLLAEPFVEQTPVGRAVRAVGQRGVASPAARRASVSPGRAPRTWIGPVMMCTPGARLAGAIAVPDRRDSVIHQKVRRIAGVVGHRLDPQFLTGSTASTAGSAGSRYPQKQVSGVATSTRAHRSDHKTTP